MSENRRSRKAANAPGRQGGFQLPPNVSVEKQRLSYGWAYVFGMGRWVSWGAWCYRIGMTGAASFPVK